MNLSGNSNLSRYLILIVMTIELLQNSKYDNFFSIQIDLIDIAIYDLPQYNRGHLKES